MLRKAAMAFGAVFLLIGVMGFIPAFTTANDDGMRYLLGLFMVDDVHNWVHILSGLAALVAASRADWSRLFFQIFAVVYGLVTVWGLFDSPVLGFLHVNAADNILHLLITAATAYLGFVYRDQPAEHTENDAIINQ